MMQNIGLINGYEISQLSIQDNGIVEELCNKCSDYFILSGGISPSKDDVNALFTDLPPGKDLEDKFLLGVYKSNELIGIIDIIKDFPAISEWTIGLLILEPEERGRGAGIIIHKALVEWARNLGAKRFSIGVIKGNDRAFKFWTNLGYIKIKEINVDIELKNQVVNLMIMEF